MAKISEMFGGQEAIFEHTEDKKIFHITVFRFSASREYMEVKFNGLNKWVKVSDADGNFTFLDYVK